MARRRRKQGTGAVYFSARQRWCITMPSGLKRSGYDSREEATAALEAFLVSGEPPADRRYRLRPGATSAIKLGPDDVEWARRYVGHFCRQYPHLAEDIRSEAALALWLAALDFRPGERAFRDFARPRLWGSALDFLRSHDRSIRTTNRREKRLYRVHLKDPLWNNLPSSSPRTDDDLEYRQKMRILRAQVDSLPEPSRTMFAAYVFEHRRLADIGRDFGITESRVSQRVKEAARKIAAAAPIRAIREAA